MYSLWFSQICFFPYFSQFPSATINSESVTFPTCLSSCWAHCFTFLWGCLVSSKFLQTCSKFIPFIWLFGWVIFSCWKWVFWVWYFAPTFIADVCLAGRFYWCSNFRRVCVVLICAIFNAPFVLSAFYMTTSIWLTAIYVAS